MKNVLILGALSLVLTGCGTLGRLKEVGQAPAMSPADEYAVPTYERSIARSSGENGYGAPPQGGAIPPRPASASLFRDGAGQLFQDQRASRVGDILTVMINVEDRANVDNSTSRSRSGSEEAGLSSLLGLAVGNIFDSGLDSQSRSAGEGNTSRSERIEMTVAAIVTDVLSNGNLVIRGRQEMRVNFELRELIVTGIVRPQDIARGNTIPHSRIAEARISYGGRGHLTDVQQARWGQQIYEALFPF